MFNKFTNLIFWRLHHFLTKLLIFKLHIFCKPAGTTRKTFTFRDLFKTFYGKSVLSAMQNLSFLTWKNSIIFSFLEQKNVLSSQFKPVQSITQPPTLLAGCEGSLDQGQSLATGRCISTFFWNFLKVEII